MASTRPARVVVPAVAFAVLVVVWVSLTQTGGHQGSRIEDSRIKPLTPPQLEPVRTTSALSSTWNDVGTGMDDEYRGLAAVNRRVAWVSGEHGGVLRTTDGGRSWKDVAPPHTATMSFRDVEVTGPGRASVLAVGSRTGSRIYTTVDGGRSWLEAFVNEDPRAFYDCMTFWPGTGVGLAVSDPVGGRFRLVRTDDGGRTWHREPATSTPPALPGEFSFAASGTCLVTAGSASAYLATGGSRARVFRTDDRGRTWQVGASGLPAAVDVAGVYSLAFKDAQVGIAVGGDYTAPTRASVSSRTTNGGRSFGRVSSTLGFRSGAAWVNTKRDFVVAVGPTGSDLSADAGTHWSHVDDVAYNAVACTADGSCWAAGPHGAVGRIVFR